MREGSLRLFGRTASPEVDLVLVRAVDLPYGLARRYLETAGRPPSNLRTAAAAGVGRC